MGYVGGCEVYVYVSMGCAGLVVNDITEISVDNFDIEVNTASNEIHLQYTLDRWMYNSTIVRVRGTT